jgi:hypothetical protein
VPGDMPRLPALDIAMNVNHSPHVVILGAGASAAACPTGDRNGRRVPLMADLVEAIGLTERLMTPGVDLAAVADFEQLYQEIASDHRHESLRLDVERTVRDYFASLVLPEGVTIYDELLLSLRTKDLIATL